MSGSSLQMYRSSCSIDENVWRYAKGLQLGGSLVRGFRQGQDDVTQMRAAFSALDTTVGQDAQFSVQLGGAALEVLGGAAHGQDGFAQLPDRGV